MKKKDAIKLERKIENGISLVTKQEWIEISLTLIGRLKVKIGKYLELNFDKISRKCICLRSDCYEDYNELIATIEEIEKYFSTNKDDLDNLVWSYQNMDSLEEDEGEC